MKLSFSFIRTNSWGLGEGERERKGERKERGREKKREKENGVREKEMGGRKEERAKGRSVRPEARLHVRSGVTQRPEHNMTHTALCLDLLHALLWTAAYLQFLV